MKITKQNTRKEESGKLFKKKRIYSMAGEKKELVPCKRRQESKEQKIDK